MQWALHTQKCQKKNGCVYTNVLGCVYCRRRRRRRFNSMAFCIFRSLFLPLAFASFRNYFTKPWKSTKLSPLFCVISSPPWSKLKSIYKSPFYFYTQKSFRFRCLRVYVCDFIYVCIPSKFFHNKHMSYTSLYYVCVCIQLSKIRVCVCVCVLTSKLFFFCCFDI